MTSDFCDVCNNFTFDCKCAPPLGSPAESITLDPATAKDEPCAHIYTRPLTTHSRECTECGARVYRR